MSSFDNSDDSGKVTLTDANTAKSGYADESDIAKRKFDLDTPEANENPVGEERTLPNEQPTVSLGAKIENQDELFSGSQTDDEQDFETADETVEMKGSNEQQFKADRDIRWVQAEKMDRGEYETKSDDEVAENMGLADLPVADQSDKEPIPEMVDRRSGESLAMMEQRIGEEADHARLADEARAIAEPTTPPVEQGGQSEAPVENVKYASGWFDADKQSDESEMDPTRRRAESATVAAEAMAESRHADFDERAKLAVGFEPTESWSAKDRIGEEIIELGQHVDRVAEAAGISPGQALILLCEKRLETSSAEEAALKAVGAASSYFKDAPTPITEVHHRSLTATVEGKVTHLFDPMNANEHQVALIEDTMTGESFKFIIHERTRRSRAWTEWNGDEIVTDLREGDVVRITDGKPHYAGGGRVGVKIHASSWTVIRRKERGEGEFVSKHTPRAREIVMEDRDLPGTIEESAFKPPAAYATKKSTLDERRAKMPNEADSDTHFERRETSDPRGIRVFSSVSSSALCG